MEDSDKLIVSNVQSNLFPIALQHKCDLYSEWILAEVPFTPSQTFSVLDLDERAGTKRHPLHKICHTHPAMMKLGTVIPYLKMLQKIYESRDTPL